jgi:FAD/FMN-containing dehydrogenase
MNSSRPVSAADLSGAITEWQQVLGKAWVFTETEDLALYRDAYSPFRDTPAERKAAAALAPANVEQVQEVVRIANRRKVPLYTISTGRNLAYGGSAPVYSGSVVLDLKRMNRVLEVSETNASALVEPGVSYFDLYRYIREHKLKLWIDCPDPGWGSPIGNALDHGAGYTSAPYRDHFAAQCGMEVVLANGDIVRTGMGAMPGAQTWQQFKYGTGPYIDGIFSQSNFGIVTKMGLWLMPEPEIALSVSVTVPRHDDLVPLCDAVISLIYSDIVKSQTQVASPVIHDEDPTPELSQLLGRWDEGRVAALDAYAQRKSLPFWICPFTFYGPEAVVRAQWEHAQRRFASIPGVRFTEDALLRFPLTDEQIDEVTVKPRVGLPSLRMFSSRRGPNGPPLEGHIGFSPVVPMRGNAIMEAVNVTLKALHDRGIAPVGGMPLFYHLRACMLIYSFPVGRDPKANQVVLDACARMIALCGSRGWGEYRMHPAYMDQGVGLYNFNDHALLRTHERIKDALDPNGILSAGRYGIWPRHMRKSRA